MNRIARTVVQVALVVAAISWGSQALSQDGGHDKSSLLLGCGAHLPSAATIAMWS